MFYIGQMVRVNNFFCGDIITFVTKVTDSGVYFEHNGEQYYELNENVTPFEIL